MRTSSAALLVLALCAPAVAFAHHSFAMYDSTKLVIVDGNVTNFQWTNPHVLLWLNGTVNGEAEPTLWTVELPTSPGNLGRMGWTKHSLKAGDHVVVELNPLRDGKHGGSFKKATLPASGKVLLANPVSRAADGTPNFGPAEAKPGASSTAAPKSRWSCALGVAAAGSGSPFLLAAAVSWFALRRRRARSL